MPNSNSIFLMNSLISSSFRTICNHTPSSYKYFSQRIKGKSCDQYVKCINMFQILIF